MSSPAETRSPAANEPASPWLDRLRRLRRPLRAAGWLLLVAAGSLQLLEASGRLTDVVRDQLTRRLAPLGERVTLDSASLAWFVPALRLHGLRVGDEEETVGIDECEIRLGFSLTRGLHVSALVVRGGRVTLSPALQNGIRGVLVGETDGEAPAPGPAALPDLHVRDFQVGVEHALVGRVPIGTCDLDLAVDGAGPVLRGRLRPTPSPGAPATAAVFLSGSEVAPGAIAVRALTRDLALTRTRALSALLEGTRGLEPSALLAVDARATVFPAEGRIAAAEARLVVSEGSVRPVAGAAPFEDLRILADWRFAPGPEPSGDSAAWQGRLVSSGRWNGLEFTAGARAGGETSSPSGAEAWAVIPGLVIDEDLRALGGDNRLVSDLFDSLGIRGTVETRIGLRLPRGWRADRDSLGALEVAVDLRSEGTAVVTYAGYPNPLSGERDLGFPLPIDGLTGHVAFAYRPTLLQREITGLVDLAGRHPAGGPVRASGVVLAPPWTLPPPAIGRPFPEITLQIEGEAVPVDAALERALDGLTGAVPHAVLRDRYRPTGGQLDLDVYIWRRPEDFLGVGTRVVADTEGMQVTLQELPIPVSDVRVTVEFLNEGRLDVERAGEWGVRFDGVGTLSTASGLEIIGHAQSDQVHAPTRYGDPAVTFGVVDAQVERLSLVGSDAKLLDSRFEGLARGRLQFGPKGFADVALTRAQPLPGGRTLTLLEVEPSGPVELKPEVFQMITKDVRGRVLASIEQGEEASEPLVELRVWPLTGRWGTDVRVAVLADASNARPGSMRLLGAGIDVTNRGLLGSLDAALRSGAGAQSFDTDAFTLDGRVDFVADLVLPGETDEAPQGRYGLFMRENDFRTRQGFELQGLTGALELGEGVLRGAELEAILGETPVRLVDSRLAATTDGFEFRTHIDAANLPLDREHLGSFMDAETLDALIDELDWRGRVDLHGAELTVVGRPDAPARLELRGELTLSDMFLRMGLPVSIRSSRATVEELVYEDGHVRGWGRLEDLFGLIAERNLGPADMQVAYYDTHLSIENLDGNFAGGSLRSLGGRSLAVALDLTPPFPFQVALALGTDGRGAEVRGLLRDLFPSNVANRGHAFGTLRLRGELGHLLGIEGDGSIRVRNTVLWSIPVFRALFAVLGFDDTAAQFDRMVTLFEVEGGVITMRDVEVKSDLLHLVGDGTLGFDGSLHYDLQVQYSLVNRLGPFKRLLYWVQNRLLSVSIRGDMSRPRVVLKTALYDILGLDREYRALPLPDLSGLSSRF